MSTDIDGFLSRKKADSEFLSLGDTESAVVKLQEIKLVTKAGYGGEEKEVVRLVCEVDTEHGKRVKKFDNGTQRFAEELKTKGVVVGAVFKITRTGLQTKTRYTITDIRLPGAASQPVVEPAPAK